MSKSRLVITALFIDHQTPSEVAARYGVHRSWVYKLKARYQAEGEAAFEPRSRRPKTSPTATPPATVELILKLRRTLASVGLDAGPDTIAWHLTQHHRVTVSTATISRHLTKAGLVTPEPKKKPKSSYGAVTLRVNGKMHHIGVGRTHARTHVILLIQDLNVRIVNAVTGELLRELTIDPNRDYQGRNQDHKKNS